MSERKAIFRKRDGKLWPVDEHAQDHLAKIKEGSLVSVEVKRPRNIGFHRKYWSLLDLVLNALPEGIYRDVDALHDGLKIAMGYTIPIKLLSGEEAYLPMSISFSKMDQQTFASYYDATCNFLAMHFLPNVTDKVARGQLLEMMSLPPDLDGER